MKIGIGITTMNRRKVFDLTFRQLQKHTRNATVEFAWHIQNFWKFKHKSIAEVKNLCLRELVLQNCDHYFLFDDDCFPIRDDWWEIYLAARTGGVHHMQYMIEDVEKYGLKGRKILDQYGDCNVFRNTAGCLLYMDREAVLGVGAFDERFIGYGYEHENYSMRIQQAGLNPHPFLVPKGAQEVIHSLDLNGVEGYESRLEHAFHPQTGRLYSANSNPRILKHLRDNQKRFNEPSPIYIPLFK